MAAGNVILGSETIHQAHTHTQGTSKSISAFVPERKTHTHRQTRKNMANFEEC